MQVEGGWPGVIEGLGAVNCASFISQIRTVGRRASVTESTVISMNGVQESKRCRKSIELCQ